MVSASAMQPPTAATAAGAAAYLHVRHDHPELLSCHKAAVQRHNGLVLVRLNSSSNRTVAAVTAVRFLSINLMQYHLLTQLLIVPTIQ